MIPSKKIQWLLFGISDWELGCLDLIASNCKSFIIAAAVWKKHINAKQAFAAAMTEELYQQSLAGEVEGAHDLDRANFMLNVGASAMCLYLLPPKLS